MSDQSSLDGDNLDLPLASIALGPWPETSWRSLALRGSLWTLAGLAVTQVLTLASNLALTRLLVPDVFGLTALAGVLVAGLEMLSDVGIGPVVVQHERGDQPDFYNTAWTIQILRGLGIFAVASLLAWPAALFYGEPLLLWVILLANCSALITAFGSTSLYTLNRHLALGRRTLIELACQLASVIVKIGWALLSPTVWALTAGPIVASGLRTAISHSGIAGVSNRLAGDPTAVRTIVSFGGWIFLSTAFTYFADQSDRLIFGKLISLHALGIYSIAIALVAVPRSLIHKLGRDILFPLASRSAQLPREQLRALVARDRMLILGVLGAGVVALTLCGDFVMTFLYDERYHAAAWVVPALALGLWPLCLSETAGPAVLAVAGPRFLAYGNALRFGFLAAGVPAGLAMAGVPGAIAAVALRDVPYYLSVSRSLRSEGLLYLRQDLIATGLLLLALAFGVAARLHLSLALPFDPSRFAPLF